MRTGRKRRATGSTMHQPQRLDRALSTLAHQTWQEGLRGQNGPSLLPRKPRWHKVLIRFAEMSWGGKTSGLRVAYCGHEEGLCLRTALCAGPALSSCLIKAVGTKSAVPTILSFSAWLGTGTLYALWTRSRSASIPADCPVFGPRSSSVLRQKASVLGPDRDRVWLGNEPAGIYHAQHTWAGA